MKADEKQALAASTKKARMDKREEDLQLVILIANAGCGF